SRAMAKAETGAKNQALMSMAHAVERDVARLLDANRMDLQAAQSKGLEAAMLDRLTLTSKSLASMAEGLRQIAQLPDPVGEISGMSYQPSGIRLGRWAVPLGVLGIFSKARPNVTADAAALCLKSGNAAILRGGSEAFRSNQAIAEALQVGLAKAQLSPDCVQLVPPTDRESMLELLKLEGIIDLCIPRG